MFKDQLDTILDELNSFSLDRDALFYSFVKERLENELNSYVGMTSSSLESLLQEDSFNVMRGMVE